MDFEAAELQDWEVLLPNPVPADSGFVASAENPNAFEEIGADSEGMVHANYFSIDSAERYVGTVAATIGSEAGSEASDNPSWIDPGLETGYPRKDSGESWPDSGSDRSDDRKLEEFEGKGEMGILQKEKIGGVFDGIEEIGGGNEKKFWSDSGGIEMGGLKIEQFEESKELGVEGNAKLDETESIGSNNVDESEPRKAEEVKRSVVWWKVPFELLKYCVFRANPVWTFSVAAAVMGFVILGRRLVNMKKKTRNLELKVTMDDKKVSQFMSRAARLNEAFSVVKRAPVIRPQLPAAGVIPWPVMALI
nr:Transmembrane protein [Ipomoea batatas]GMD72780.1 Transmembrane protein [Ipomoea batatas]